MRLNGEYLSWVRREMVRCLGAAAHDKAGLSCPEEGYRALRQICADQGPRGVFYLILLEDKVAGMCGLRSAHGDIAEIKRIYVRPPYRGKHLGQQALRRLIEDARILGFGGICLDTAPFMTEAHRLYESHGFADCPAYEGTEVPPEFRAAWRFMSRSVMGTRTDGRP